MKTVQLRLRSWGYWIMGKDDAQTKGIKSPALKTDRIRILIQVCFKDIILLKSHD